ncbi:MAG: hypothetical protein H6R26_3445, partial [Proteobacteria bacterium]|nr:hypothetical protein [Pseudomonadota bacterium]
EALRLANERFRRFAESNIVGIVIATSAGVVLEANDYFLNLIGFTRQELERGEVNWRAITPPEYMAADEQALRELRDQGVCAPYEKEYVRRDGSRVPVLLARTTLPGPGEQIAAFCLDITERKAATERIKFLAHYDELTGLPKRGLLQDRLEMALAAAERNQRRVALLYLDLDRFKNINDSLGHPIGDKLLKAAADRLKACLRRQDTLARTGGDEFIVVLPNVQAAEEASEAAEKLRHAMKAPFRIDGHELYVTLSLGISLYPNDGSGFESLSRSADAALYQAKASGRDRFQFFTAELNDRSRQILRMENALRRALAHEEFELHYQPQWDMVDNRIIGLEALLRWRDPEEGWVAPADFIPLAEKNHLILPLGEWVIRAACTQNCLWQAKGLQPLPVAVNISSLQISQPAFSQIVAQTLEDTRLQPEYLELELTESILMEKAETAIDTLRALKSMGLRLAIDDFGTGYSSLSYLKHLPIDKLKIDRSFVRDIATDPNDVMIIRAIIGLADSLQLKVLAEGVETRAQTDFLLGEQCQEAQGYYFSQPLPPDRVEALLRKSA